MPPVSIVFQRAIELHRWILVLMERFCTAPICGKPLVRRDGEAASKFNSRRTCGASCGNSLPRARINRYASFAGVCRFCGRPTKVKTNGEAMVSCSMRACRKKAYQGRRLTDRLPWPQQTGEVAMDFRAHNITPLDGYGTLPLRPETMVKTQSGIA